MTQQRRLAFDDPDSLTRDVGQAAARDYYKGERVLDAYDTPIQRRLSAASQSGPCAKVCRQWH